MGRLNTVTFRNVTVENDCAFIMMSDVCLQELRWAPCWQV